MCEAVINAQLNNLKQLFGRIYLATNTINGKVYVGKVEFPRKIRERWLEHYTEARKLKSLRDQNPKKKIWGSHLNNALLKYPKHIWKLNEIDIAYNKVELNKKEKFWIKKYDSMNPKKGYNMREGGEGGRIRAEVKKKISYAIKKKYREDPIFRERMRFLSKERMKDPEYKAQHVRWLHEGLKKKRQEDPQFREKMRKFIIALNKKKRSNPEFIQKQKESHEHERKEIPNIQKFLQEIKDGKESRELVKEYKMSRPTINKRIREILGKYNVKNYKEAKAYLKEKNIDSILKRL